MLDLNDIGSWDYRLRILLLVSLGFFAIFLGYNEIFLESAQEKKLQIQQYSSLQNKLRIAESKEQKNKITLKGQGSVKRKFTILNKKLAKKFNIATLIATLAEYITLSDLTCEKIIPVEILSKNCYLIYPIKLVVHGTYHNIIKLLQHIASIKRLCVIQNIKIFITEDNADSTMLTTELLLYVYTA